MRKGITVVRAHTTLSVCLLLAMLAVTGGGVFAVLANPATVKTAENVQSAEAPSPAVTAAISQHLRQLWQNNAEALGIGVSENNRLDSQHRRGAREVATTTVEAGNEAQGLGGESQTPAFITPAQISAVFPGISATSAVADRLEHASRVMHVLPDCNSDAGERISQKFKNVAASRKGKVAKTASQLLSGLDVATDFPVLLASLGFPDASQPAMYQTIDLNCLTWESGSAQFGMPNGIPDFAELLLLEQALKDSSFDMGGVTNADLVSRWNAMEAQFVLAEGVSAVNPSVERMALAYCMLGDWSSIRLGVVIAFMSGLALVDDNSIDVVFSWVQWQWQWQFSLWGDPDGDTFSNLLEWQETANLGGGEGEGEVEGEGGGPTFAARYAAYSAAALSAAQQPSGSFYTVTFAQTGPSLVIFPDQMKFKTGTTATLWAIPQYPWKFTGWTVDSTVHQENPLVLSAGATVHAQYDPDPTAELYFDDPRLEQAVRVALNKLTGPILWSEVMGDNPLTSLDASGLGITSLNGLEQLIALTSVNLYDNNIMCLDAFWDLTTLTEVNLGHNRISNLAPMASLPNLTGLVLGRGNIFDQELDIFNLPAVGNLITDISPLAGLENLQVLDLSGNCINDLAPLAGMTGLYGLLLDGNPILDQNAAENLTVLEGFGDLIALGLGGTNLTNAILAGGGTPLFSHWPYMVAALLSDNPQITTLTGLDCCDALEGVLCFNCASLANISALQDLSHLDCLVADNTQISSLAALADKPLMHFLYVPHNQITVLDALVPQTFTGAIVDLIGNHLVMDTACPQMDAIRTRGNAVYYDEACGNSELLTTSVVVNPAEGEMNGPAGSISPFVGSHLVPVDENISLRAIQSNTEYTFSHWEGDASGTNFNTSVIMPARAQTVTAVFTHGERTLTMLEPEGSGTVTPAPGIWACLDGEQRNVGAVPKPGWAFKRWSDENGNTVYPYAFYTFDMTTNFTFKAEFVPAEVTLDMAQVGNGYMAPDLGRHYYLLNDPVSLWAMRGESDCFSYWLETGGDNLLSVIPWTNIVMDRSRSICGYFGTCDTVSLDLRVTGQGTVDPDAGRLTYPRYATLTITAVPAKGWLFDHWEGDVVSGANPSASLTMDTSHAATAVFVADVPVEFQDANLGQAVRDVLGIPTGTLYRGELASQSLSSLTVDNQEIHSLEGLQYCASLQSLFLTRVNASESAGPLDLTPLTALMNLALLDLDNTPLVSLVPLGGLSGLKTLVLSNCGISNLSPLSGLTALEALSIDNNPVSSLQDLSGMTQLTWLDLHNDPVVNISPVAGMISLRHFIANGTNIVDIGALVANTSIGYEGDDTILLWGAALSDTALCEQIPVLQSRGGTVGYSGSCYPDPVEFPDSALAQLIRDALNKPFGPIHRWDLVGHGLYFLDAHNKDIQSIEGLQYCADLAVFSYGRDNMPSPAVPLDLTPLAGLKNLILLDLHGTPLASLSPLADLTGLRVLLLYNCGISNLLPLSGLVDLELLDISSNPVGNLEALSEMTQLRDLNLIDDPVVDIAPVAGMSSLRHFLANGTNIIDVAPLVANTSVGYEENDSIMLWYAPLSHAALCSEIPLLQLRPGVTGHSGVCRHNLVVQVQGDGTVAKLPDSSDYAPGTVVTLAAMPINPALSPFDHWEGDLTGTDNPAAITMDDDKTVTAVFVAHARKLSVEVQGQGTVTPGAGDHYYDTGDVVAFSTAPAEGYMLDHWEGDLEGSDHNPQLTMTQDRYVIAVFVQGTLKSAFKATPTAGLSPLAVHFFDQSAWRDSPIAAWEWNFGDGTQIDSAASPIHVYQSPGIYDVSLTVFTAAGSDTLTKAGYVYVQTPPTASFSATPLNGPAPLNVHFTDTSLAGNTPPILSWSWNFGDGATSADVSPTHLYQFPGTYDVSLTVSTAAGSNTVTEAHYIHAQRLPTASFSAGPVNGSAPLTVSFTDTSLPGDAPIVSWLWDFGDGTASTDESPQHVYEAAGKYSVVLRVTTAAGSNTSIRANLVSVQDSPVATFDASPRSGPIPLEVHFVGGAGRNDASVPTWAWNFGDGASSMERSPVHTYRTVGAYTVSLTVTNAVGENTKTENAFITTQAAAPKAVFNASPTYGRAPLTVDFCDVSVPNGAPITQRQWDFGDSETSSEQSLRHTYIQAGTYEAALTVQNSEGTGTCTTTIRSVATSVRFYVVPPGPNGSTKETRDGSSWANALTRIGDAAAQLANCPDAEIWIAQGVYNEAVEIPYSGDDGHAWVYGGFAGTEEDLSDRNPTLHPTILDGSGVEGIQCGDEMAAVLHLVDITTVVDGLTVTGGSDYGVLTSGADVTISHCTLAGNAGYGAGLWGLSRNSDSSHIELSNCVVSGNGGGVRSDQTRAIVRNTVITGNAGNGVEITQHPGSSDKDNNRESKKTASPQPLKEPAHPFAADEWVKEVRLPRDLDALFSAGDTSFNASTGRITKSGQAEWTVLVYMDGDNNLEDNAINDFLEMSEIGSSNKVNIVVLFDRSPSHTGAYGNWSGARQGIVQKGDTPGPAWGTPVANDLDMGNPQTLTGFCRWGMSTYPATQYALVLWNHGGGWSKSVTLQAHPFKEVCYDDTSGSVLSVADVEQAIFTATPAKPFSLIGFDACLMGMAEVAYSMGQTQASVMVASEDLEPSNGWPYAEVFSQLEASPEMGPAQFGAIIVDAYYGSYGRSQTMSAVNLRQMGDVAKGITTLGASIKTDAIGNPHNCEAKATELMAALDNAVIRERHGNTWAGSHGLSIYFPYPSDPVQGYEGIPFNTGSNWYTFLEWFAGLSDDSWVRQARNGVPTYGPQGDNADLYAFCSAVASLAQQQQTCLKLVNCTIANQPTGLNVWYWHACGAVNTIFANNGLAVHDNYASASTHLANCLFFQNGIDYHAESAGTDNTPVITELKGSATIDAYLGWQSFNTSGDPKFNRSPVYTQLTLSGQQSDDDLNRTKFTATGLAPGALVGKILRLPPTDGLDGPSGESLIVANTETEIEVLGPMAAALRSLDLPPSVPLELADSHIADGSAAIDKADPAQAPPEDIDGDPRQVPDGPVDIGADEVDASCAATPETEIYNLPSRFQTLSFFLPYRVLGSSAAIANVSVMYRFTPTDGQRGDWTPYPGLPHPHDPADLRIPFDATQTGGEGFYEFYSIATDGSRVEYDQQIPDASAWVVQAYPDNRIYVDANASPGGMGKSWAEAMSGAYGLCNALARAGDLQISEIWVAQGNYQPKGKAYIALQSNVALFGGFEAGETSLSDRDLAAHPSTITGGNYLSPVIFADGVQHARLNGFAVTGSAASTGIYCSHVASDVVIENCTLTGIGGCGFHLYNYGSPCIKNCTISGNALDGVLADVAAYPHITGCQIEKNQRAGIWSTGPDLYDLLWWALDVSGAEIADCVICANVRDGVLGSDGSRTKLSNCILSGNGSAGNTAYPDTGNVNLWDAADVTIENCVISKGYAYGAELASGTVVNCTITDNTGPGVYATYGRCQGPVKLGNCILAHNGGAGIETHVYGANAEAESCLFYSNTGFDYDGGTPEGQCVGAISLARLLGREAGNVDGDPSFAPPLTGTWLDVSRQGDNLVLQADSPAFGAHNLVGHRIKVVASREELVRIVANTADTVTVRAKDVCFAVSQDDAFETDGFHLQDGSNAIGRGHEFPALPLKDIDGEDRSQGNAVDIGADEAPPDWVATPQAYLINVPAVSVAGQICMEYVVEPGSEPVVSLGLLYRRFGETDWHEPETFVTGADICFHATSDGAYEFCLVANGCESYAGPAQARTTVTTSLLDRVYVNKQATAGLNTGVSWDNAFLTISEGLLAAHLAGITEVWVAEGSYNERISIPPDVKVQGGYVYDDTAHTRNITQNPARYTQLFSPQPDPISVIVPESITPIQMWDRVTPTVTMTDTDHGHQLSNAGLSGFTIHASEYFLYPEEYLRYGTGNAPSLLDVALRTYRAAPSTRISNCVFAGCDFTFDPMTFEYDHTYGIRCTDGSPTLEYCAFNQFYNGVALNGTSAPIMNYCRWDKSCTYGLTVNGTAQPELNHCTVESRVHVLDSSQITVNDSNINNGEFILRDQSMGTIAGCVFNCNMEVHDNAGAGISDSVLCIYIDSKSQANRIANCAFQGNAGAGISCWAGSYAEFRNCVIAGNGLSANDGAILCYGCSPKFINCTIAENAGTAVVIGPPDCYYPEVHPEFQNCIITDHHGSGSAGISCYRHVNVNEGIGGDPVLKDGLPTLANCLFYGNDGGDLLVYEGSTTNATPVYGASGVKAITGSASTIFWGDPKFVRDLSGTWNSITRTADEELTLERAGSYEEVGDLAGRFLITNCKYARQTRILRSPTNPPPNHNTIVIPHDGDYILAKEGDKYITVTQGVHQNDSFRVVNYRLQDGSMAVDGGDIGSAPERDADGHLRPSGVGAHVSIGAYEPPEEYVVGTPGPYTRVTALEGMVEGGIVGFNFNVEFVANSSDTKPVTHAELWYKFNEDDWTLYGTFLPTETPIPFNADDTGLNATGTKAGTYAFYTIGIMQDGTREDPPFVPDATCEVVAPWDGITPICVAFDASADEGRQKTGIGWENAFRELSNAIERARVYKIGEIWMKQGDYTEQNMYRSGDVAIYGGFAGTETPGDQNARRTRNTAEHPTTIGTEIGWVGTDDEGTDTPPSLWCYQIHNLLLDGLTLSRGAQFSECDGSNTIQNCTIKNVAGDSVTMYKSSPRFSNCTITSDTGICSVSDEKLSPCTMTGADNGIDMVGGAPSFTDCDVDGVFWSAVLVDAGATPTFAGCHIFSRQPFPFGDARYLNSSPYTPPFMKSAVSCFCNAAPLFQSCTIAGSAEAGVYVSQWPDGCTLTDETQGLVPVFDDCVISVSGMTPWMSHRRREGYGIVCTEAATTPQFSRCRIQGNYVGVYADDSQADFTNCIIADNGRTYTDGGHACLEGAGVFCKGSSAPAFLNCTVSDNPNVAVEADGSQAPSLINCIITGTDGAEAVKHRCPDEPALMNCFFNNNQADFGAVDNHGVLKTVRGAANLAKVRGIIAPVDGAPHFLPPVRIGSWRAVQAPIQENGYRVLFMLGMGAYTRFTAAPNSFGTENLAGKFILAVSDDGVLYAKSGLIIANTGSTIDVLGDFTEKEPAYLHVVIPDYHIGDGSRALWHGTADGAPIYDIDGDPRPGSDGLVDIGADEGVPGWRPDDVYLLHLLCPNGGQISPQTGTSFHEAGTTVSLSASDTVDRGFVRWEELDAAGQVIAGHDQREMQVQMNADRTFSAVFGARIAIIVEKSGVGDTAPLTGTYSYLEFTRASFAASSVDGSQFWHWVDADNTVLGIDSVLTLTVTAPVTVRAVFAETGAVCAPPLP